MSKDILSIRRLITEAQAGLKKAYAPYSNYRVGAAILTKSGKIFTGCNIENASYGLTVCAERVALWKAVSSGETEFKIMAIVASSNKIPTPCGACRQVLYEFAPRLRLCLVTKSGKMVHRKLSSLLPCPFNRDF
jgi:cytidine deaminase